MAVEHTTGGANPLGLVRRLSDSLGRAVPGPEAPGAADLDLSIFPLVHKISESLAHSIDGSGHNRDYLPIDADPVGVLDAAKDLTSTLSAALHRESANGSDGSHVTADQSHAVPVGADGSALPIVKRITERFVEAMTDPETGANYAPLDVDVHAVSKVEEALQFKLGDKARDFLEKGDELKAERSCERSLWVL